MVAATIGFAIDTEDHLIAYLSASYFGPRHYGAVSRTLYSMYAPGASLRLDARSPCSSAPRSPTGSFICRPWTSRCWARDSLSTSGVLPITSSRPLPRRGAYEHRSGDVNE